MTPAIILLLWVAMGIVASAAFRDRDAHPWAWAPIAGILGPLWIAVAVDQRAAAGLEPALVPTGHLGADHDSGDTA